MLGSLRPVQDASLVLQDQLPGASSQHAATSYHLWPVLWVLPLQNKGGCEAVTVVRVLKGGYLQVDTRDANLERAITRVVPFVDRQKYNAFWYVHPKHSDTIRTLIKRYGGSFEAAPNADDVNNPYRVLYLVKDAPDFVVEAAWKAIVRTKHPDVGGDPDEFLTFKQAYEKIKRP